MKAGINQIQSYVPEEPVQRVKSKYHLKRLARLSANENPYGTSPMVKEALINVINDGRSTVTQTATPANCEPWSVSS